jgi:hypothetical protein
MPLTKKSKFGISYLYQPILCHQLGVFSTVKDNVFCIDNFLQAIPEKFKIVDIAINSSNCISANAHPHQIIERQNQKLEIHLPYDNIKDKYSKSHRKNINRFLKRGNCKIETNFGYLDFYRHKMDSFTKLGVKLSKQERLNYLNLLKELDQKKRLKIYLGVDTNDRVVGGICFLFLDFNAVTIQSFINEDGKKSGLVFYLLDDFIRANSEKQITIDFMGSSIPGIRERNLGFGSQEYYYNIIRITRLNYILRKIKKLVGKWLN